MALDLRLQQKMAQTLVMTPQLQQAIKLLQLSHLEMAEVLREELEQNPLLEERSEGSDAEANDELRVHGGDEPPASDPAAPMEQALDMLPTAGSDFDASGSLADGGDNDFGLSGDPKSASDAPLDATPEPSEREVEGDMDWDNYADANVYGLPTSGGNPDDMPSYEATLFKATSLIEHLRWQAQMAAFDPADLHIAALLIEEINDDGYLSPDAIEDVAEELGVDVDQVAVVLAQLQDFDPPGVGARSLQECLLLQARHLAKDNPLVPVIIEKYLPQVERRNLSVIAKDIGVSVDEVAVAISVITRMEPRPGRRFTDREPQYITPDIFLTKVGDAYVITLNEDGLPRLRVSNHYRDAMSQSSTQTRSYIQEKLRAAAWLIRSIHMRQRTIYRVMESILRFQRDFFDRGVAHLKPLILREVAEDVEMHESTISRVTSNKYVHTPQGIYELKFFFNSSINRVDGASIASESVRTHIEQLIGSEDPRSPYSDQKIVEILKSRDIDIARRTVAKYREMLKIASSSKRKRFF